MCETGYFGLNCDSQKPPCPTNDSNYHKLNDSCYFFEKTYLTFEKAKSGCSDKFVGGGKLYEPRSMTTFKKIYKEAKQIMNLSSGIGVWLGVDDLAEEGKFAYSSSGLPFSLEVDWYSGYGRKGSSNNCILVAKDLPKWYDYNCQHDSGWPSICEPMLQ